MEADGVILRKGEHILLEERASRQLFGVSTSEAGLF